VVQDALLEASRRLSDYARNPSLPFYPWLRQIAWQRLVDLHRRHLRAQKRSIARENPPIMDLSERSAIDLAECLMSSGTNPSTQLMRQEMRERVRRALGQLPTTDREVLVMRHLEQLKLGEIAAILGISEAAAKMRRLRAVRRLQRVLGDDSLGRSQ
jgi:RNA polymerase sigma-70 factor (ECF subfamily)